MIVGQQGSTEEAEGCYRRGQAILEKAPNGPVVAGTLHNLKLHAAQAGRSAENAGGLPRRARPVQEEALGVDDHPRALCRLGADAGEAGDGKTPKGTSDELSRWWRKR